MNKLVEKYLNYKAKEAADAQQEEKNALLIQLGLYEKEYSADDEESVEYPELEWDAENKNYKYYKKVAVAVSDDEYLEILKYQKGHEEEEKKKNNIAIVFKVMAWLTFVAGFIAGIALGQKNVRAYYSEFSLATALIYWASGFAGGMTFLGLAEIIQLLQDIKMKK